MDAQDQTSIPTTLAFEGAQTMVNVEDAHASLLRLLGSAAPIAIDLSGVTESDLAFVQLLLATRASAVAAGTPLRWVGFDNQAIVSICGRAGLNAAALFQSVGSKGETA